MAQDNYGRFVLTALKLRSVDDLKKKAPEMELGAAFIDAIKKCNTLVRN
jgi:hypothetical protein